MGTSTVSHKSSKLLSPRRIDPRDIPGIQRQIAIQTLKARKSHDINMDHALRPRMDLCDDPESPTLRATLELPGMRKDEIYLDIQNGCLVVTGERKRRAALAPTNNTNVDKSESDYDSELGAAINAKYPTQEIKYGRIRRVIALPSGVEASEITASMEDGLLFLTWPRATKQSQAQRILIQ